jgi:2-polyprenyl-6-methoxyphenol hydroxylase-like FAD-dependent oxidoreductase
MTDALSEAKFEPQVLVVGGGPVGLTLAIDLGRRGIRCLLVERNAGPTDLPKMERCNARTMEIFRRMGIADRVRAAGLPGDVPMDVYITTSLVAEPILHLPYPSPEQAKADGRAVNDGTQPLEPYQLISQYVLEPVLTRAAEELDDVRVVFGCELESFTQDEHGVTAQLAGRDGRRRTVRVPYLVGCDGGSSTVRKALGIGLEGRGDIAQLRQVFFRCDELIERVPRAGRARHFYFADTDARIIGTAMVVQSDQRHFTFHTGLPEDTDFVPVIQEKIGLPVDLQIVAVTSWTLHLLLAERYRAGRVFLAGDAAHLVIPQGGLGMNTGIGDAADLSWKLAAVLDGWGGPQLLSAYEVERRQVGQRNLRASEYAALGTAEWRKASTALVGEDSPAGEAMRRTVAREANVHQRKGHEMHGIELGYRYLDSPIIRYEGGEEPDPYTYVYAPSASPGHRLPHLWLEDGSAMHDRLGDGYTLVSAVAASSQHDTKALERAFDALGAPLRVEHVTDAAARRLLGCDLVLVRPDLHVAWRGNAVPRDPAGLASVVTGGHDPVSQSMQRPGRPERIAPTA